MNFGAAAAVLALALFAPAVEARSKAARAEFQRHHPCPATGQQRGPCAGYVVDHVVPLCAGGADHPINMQWQTTAEAKAKDQVEVKLCRSRAR